MYYVYILRLKDNSLYIGYSTDLKNRLKYHSQGLVESTKHLLPIKLIFYSAFENKAKASQFEKYLKSSSGFAFRNKHLL
ncbi:MAG: GIY-YIG nuclease family protein [Patescibacteria group bacterium]